MDDWTYAQVDADGPDTQPPLLAEDGSRNNFAAIARCARYDVPVVMRRVFRNMRTPSVTRRHQLSR